MGKREATKHSNILLSIRNLTVAFRIPRGILTAVDDFNLDIYRGECLALVGESGCGKSVFAHTILRITDPNEIIKSGEIYFEGKNVFEFNKDELRKYRWRDVSIIFQGAMNSLNPILRVLDHMIDTVQAHEKTDKEEIVKRSTNLLSRVRLDAKAVLNRYPHELSGGMKQRVVSAMAMLLQPKLIILDEPTSALDMLTQKFFIRILSEIKRKTNITMIFITHDIATVAEIADRVAVMYAGKIVEVGDVNDIFYRPVHPYTRALLSSIPSIVGDVNKFKPIPGRPPDPVNPPPGCRFHPRCPFRVDICSREIPKLIEVRKGQLVACHRAREFV